MPPEKKKQSRRQAKMQVLNPKARFETIAVDILENDVSDRNEESRRDRRRLFSNYDGNCCAS
jgi:hypothetical protein